METCPLPLAAVAAQPPGEAPEGARLQQELALARELDDQPLAREQRAEQAAHPADLPVQRGLPADDVAGVDDERAVDLLLHDRAVRVVEEVARAGEVQEEQPLARED